MAEFSSKNPRSAELKSNAPRSTGCDKIQRYSHLPPYLNQLNNHKYLISISSHKITVKTRFREIQTHFAKVKGIIELWLVHAQLLESEHHVHTQN